MNLYNCSCCVWLRGVWMYKTRWRLNCMPRNLRINHGHNNFKPLKYQNYMVTDPVHSNKPVMTWGYIYEYAYIYILIIYMHSYIKIYILYKYICNLLYIRKSLQQLIYLFLDRPDRFLRLLWEGERMKFPQNSFDFWSIFTHRLIRLLRTVTKCFVEEGLKVCTCAGLQANRYIDGVKNCCPETSLSGNRTHSA